MVKFVRFTIKKTLIKNEVKNLFFLLTIFMGLFVNLQAQKFSKNRVNWCPDAKSITNLPLMLDLFCSFPQITKDQASLPKSKTYSLLNLNKNRTRKKSTKKKAPFYPHCYTTTR
jgi:hypothetical protein